MTFERLRAAAAHGALAATIGSAAATAGLYVSARSTRMDLGAPARAVDLAVAAIAIALAGVGAVVLLRRSGNAVGWVFSGMGLLVAVAPLAREFAVYAIVGRANPLAGGATAAWIQSWSFVSSLTFGPALLLLLFPDGRLLGRRWQVVAWAAGSGFVLFLTGALIDSGPFDAPFSSVDNPFGIEGAGSVAQLLVQTGWWLSLASVLAGAGSLVLRFRRAGGVERQQVKWLAFAGAALVLSFLVSIALDGVSHTGEAIAVAFLLTALLGLPVGAGIAILRYRLYEIDVVINRTLVYGSTTALLAGTYVGLVLVLQLALRPLTGGSGLAVAFSTLAVAALFRPVQRRIQAPVDRRFYRRKYDAERTLQGFAARLREEIDLDALRAELTGVVVETMQPAHVSLWLRAGPLFVTPSVTIPGRSSSTTESR